MPTLPPKFLGPPTLNLTAILGATVVLPCRWVVSRSVQGTWQNLRFWTEWPTWALPPFPGWDSLDQTQQCRTWPSSLRAPPSSPPPRAWHSSIMRSPPTGLSRSQGWSSGTAGCTSVRWSGIKAENMRETILTGEHWAKNVPCGELGSGWRQWNPGSWTCPGFEGCWWCYLSFILLHCNS